MEALHLNLTLLFLPYLWAWVRNAGLCSPSVAAQLLRRSFLEEVRDPLNQKVTVFQVGKQKGHFTLGADRQRTGQDAGAVSFLDNGHLRQRKNVLGCLYLRMLNHSGLRAPSLGHSAMGH